MKTVSFREKLTEYQYPAALPIAYQTTASSLDREEKHDGPEHFEHSFRISSSMTTEISSPSGQTWLDNFDADQEDSLLDYFLNGEHEHDHEEGTNEHPAASNTNANAIEADQRMTTSVAQAHQGQHSQAQTQAQAAGGSSNSSPTANPNGSGGKAKTTLVISPALGYDSVSHQAPTSFKGTGTGTNAHDSMVSAPGYPQDQNRNQNHESASVLVNSAAGNLNQKAHPTPSTPAMQFYAGVSHKPSSTDASGNMEAPAPGHAHTHARTQHARTNTNANQHQHPHPQAKQSISFRTQKAAAQLQQTQQSKPPASSSPLLQGMGGSTPVLRVHQQFKSQGPTPPTPFNVTSMSPISPALMCTNEVLMLPSNTPTAGITAGQSISIATNPQQWKNNANAAAAAARANSNASTHNHNHNHNQHNASMELPAWLQHMNNVASLASQAGTSGSAMSVSAPQPPNPNLLHNAAFGNQHQHSHAQVPQHQIHPAYIQAAAAASGQQPGSNPISHQRQHQQHQHQHQHQHPHLQVFSGTDILPIPGTIMQQRINLKEENASESKEKRKKRLARNRESARQSRRRKKELLLNLRKQVNDLHDQIENERRRKLEHMEMEVSADRIRILNEIFLDQRYHGQSVEGMDRFTSTVRHSGPNSKERRAAVSFQFKELRKLVLPFYLQIFLSMSLKERSYFTEAKENKIKEAQKTTGRVSSKLVGEEISKQQGDNVKEGTKSNISCSASDKASFWPLLCYELSVGIEQEEKFVQAFDKVRLDPQMPHVRNEMSAVTEMISNLKEAFKRQCNSVTNQNELALLQILTPAQSLRFLEWFLRNKNRCSRILTKDGCSSSNEGGVTNASLPGAAAVAIADTTHMTKATSTQSLTDVCNQLTETMNIKKSEQEGHRIV